MGDWSKEVILKKLTKYIALEDVHKLWGFYSVLLKDLNVILGQGSVKEPKKMPANATKATINDYFSWKPTKLWDVYVAKKSSVDAHKDLCNYIINFIVQWVALGLHKQEFACTVTVFGCSFL